MLFSISVAMFAEQEEDAVIKKREREKKEDEQKSSKALQQEQELELAKKQEEERENLLQQEQQRHKRALNREAAKLKKEQENASRQSSAPVEGHESENEVKRSNENEAVATSTVAQLFDLSSSSKTEKVVAQIFTFLQQLDSHYDPKDDHIEMKKARKDQHGQAICPPFPNPNFVLQTKPFNTPLAITKFDEVTEGNEIATKKFVYHGKIKVEPKSPKTTEKQTRTPVLTRQRSNRSKPPAKSPSRSKIIETPGGSSPVLSPSGSNRIKESVFEYPIAVPEQRELCLIEDEKKELENDALRNPLQTKIPVMFDEEGCKIPAVFCDHKCCYSYADEPYFAKKRPFINQELPTHTTKYLPANERHRSKLKSLFSLVKKKNLPVRLDWYDSVNFKELCKRASIEPDRQNYERFLSGTMPAGFNARDHYDKNQDLSLWNPIGDDHIGNREKIHQQHTTENRIRKREQLLEMRMSNLWVQPRWPPVPSPSKRQKVESAFTQTLQSRDDGALFQTHCEKTTTATTYNHYCDWKKSLTQANEIFTKRLASFELHKEFNQYCTERGEPRVVQSLLACLYTIEEHQNSHFISQYKTLENDVPSEEVSSENLIGIDTNPMQIRIQMTVEEDVATNVLSKERRNLRSKSQNLTSQKTLEQLFSEIKDERDLKIVEIPTKGRGIKNSKKITAGEWVVEYKGTLLNSREAKLKEQQYSQCHEIGSYMFYFKFNNKSVCIDATIETDDKGRLINHSIKDQNLVPKIFNFQGTPRIVFVAKRDIRIGEELSYDYGDRSANSIKLHPWLADHRTTSIQIPEFKNDDVPTDSIAPTLPTTTTMDPTPSKPTEATAVEVFFDQCNDDNHFPLPAPFKIAGSKSPEAGEVEVLFHEYDDDDLFPVPNTQILTKLDQPMNTEAQMWLNEENLKVTEYFL